MIEIQELTDTTAVDPHDPSTWLTLKRVRQDIRDMLFDLGDTLDPIELQELEMRLEDVEDRIASGEIYEFPF